MCNKDDVVNSICQLNMGCLTCPVSGSNLPAVILNLHLSVFSVRYVIINPVFFFSSQFGVRNTNAYLLRSTNPISARAGS